LGCINPGKPDKEKGGSNGENGSQGKRKQLKKKGLSNHVNMRRVSYPKFNIEVEGGFKMGTWSV